jgi:hypothetical protein
MVHFDNHEICQNLVEEPTTTAIIIVLLPGFKMGRDIKASS